MSKPGTEWKFFRSQKSRSPCLGIDHDIRSDFSPRIRLYVDNWQEGDDLFKQIVKTHDVAVIWQETASPWYGMREVSEVIGELRKGNLSIAKVRVVSLSAGARRCTFVLVSDYDQWNVYDAAMTQIVRSFGTIEPWRTIKLILLCLITLFIVITFTIARQRRKTLKALTVSMPKLNFL